MYNLVHVVKRDEIGKEMNLTLRDVSGTFDLTNYTVTLTLKKGSTVATSAAAVSKRNQTTNKGECYHTWTAATIPNTDGKYKAEVKCVYGSIVRYFPVDENNERTYFTVEVQSPLE